MNIKNKGNEKGGQFLLDDDGHQIGIMHYSIAGPGKMIIDHTEVDEKYEGKGLGGRLVKAGIEFARENQLKILPLCPSQKRYLT